MQVLHRLHELREENLVLVWGMPLRPNLLVSLPCHQR